VEYYLPKEPIYNQGRGDQRVGTNFTLPVPKSPSSRQVAMMLHNDLDLS